MANERNGRNAGLDDDRQSWRPQDDADRNRRSMSGSGRDRDWDSHWDDRSSRMSDRDDDDRSDDRSIERYGQGQSGYGAGRYEDDRSYGSRNQGAMSDRQSRDRGGDDRFTGGGSSRWTPQDRMGSGMQGSHGNYGHSGHWDDEHGGGYLGQSGQQMGYGDQNRAPNMRGQYAQGGYREEHGRGGQQDRYGAQGYQGWSPAQQQDQRFEQQRFDQRLNQQHQPEHHRRYGGGRAIGEPRYSHPGQHGYGQGFGQAGIGGFGAHGIGHGFSDQGVSGSGYGHQPEHDTTFRSGQGEVYGLEGNEFSHERMYGRGREQNMYGDRSSSGMRGFGTSTQQRMYGPHRGKGPAGYTRSDDRIREMVCDVLTDDHDIDATHIEVSVRNGEVTLSGSVDDRRTKRHAEDVIESLSGVREVINNLRVVDRRNISMGSHIGASMTGSGTSVYTSGSSATTPSTSASAVDKSPPEQSMQSGNNGAGTTSTGGDGKRHRA